MISKNDLIELTVSSISSDGNGIGRAADGMAVFVPFSATGDRLRIRIVKVQKSYAFGIVDSVLEPSIDRREPDCEAFGRCGGCALRHISYEAELAAKTEFVRSALKRLGGISVRVNETIPSPLTERYRNKAQYPICERDGKLFAGFYAARSHRSVELADCALVPKVMNEVARAACELMSDAGVTAYDEQTRKGLARHMLVRRSTKDGALLLCAVLCRAAFKGEDEFVRSLLARFPDIRTVVLNENSANTNVILGERFRTIYGNGFIGDELCGVPVNLAAPSFFQINKLSAELLYGEIARLAQLEGTERVLDLFCGAGTIGLSLARKHKLHSLIGVETVESAVAAARDAAQKLGLDNCEFLLGDAEAVAEKLARDGAALDVAITDPPRKGCTERTLASLVSLAPRRIVMVSCNAATLARDLKFLESNGYITKEAVPIDMFPRTPHVECVCLMARTGK